MKTGPRAVAPLAPQFSTTTRQEAGFFLQSREPLNASCTRLCGGKPAGWRQVCHSPPLPLGLSQPIPLLLLTSLTSSASKCTSACPDCHIGLRASVCHSRLTHANSVSTRRPLFWQTGKAPQATFLFVFFSLSLSRAWKLTSLLPESNK